jgi:hypothetical protein
LAVSGLLKREVVVQDAETAVVLELAQEIHGFEIVGACFFGMIGSDMQVPQVDQGMGHGCEITLGPLNIEDLSIALFGVEKVVHERTGIAEVSERSRERLLIGGSSIISYRRFPGSASLSEISTMEKNPGPMFIVI